MPFAIAHETKPVAEESQHVIVGGNPPHKVQAGIGMQRLKEDPEGFAERFIAKVIETGQPAGLLQESGFTQGWEGGAILKKHSAEGIEDCQKVLLE